MTTPVYGSKSQAPGYSLGVPSSRSGVLPDSERHNLTGETPALHSRSLKANGLGSESPNTTDIFEEKDQNTSANAIFPGSVAFHGPAEGRSSVAAFWNSVPSGGQISPVVAVQEVSRDVVETSMDLSVPAGAPLPAVVAASLESAAAETVPSQSSAGPAPGMDGILSDYVAEAERPVPPEGRLQQAQAAAESADDRFLMLYGHDAYLKYTIEAARLSLQESKSAGLTE